jgi:hypothetical protein
MSSLFSRKKNLPFRNDTRPLGESFEDKRRMRRIDTVLAIYCENLKKGKFYGIVTSNVNVLGVKFASSVRLPVGEILEMKIILFSYLPTIITRGRVVWCQKRPASGPFCFEGGIEFLHMSQEDRIRFQRFIDKHWLN